MSRLVIISNRLPITLNRKEGEFIYYPSAGGLATGLNSLDATIEKIWIGWPGRAIEAKEEQVAVKNDLEKQNLIPVFLTTKDIELFYEGFSNKAIWPHFHYFTQYTTYLDQYWDAYLRVNQLFFEVIKGEILEGDKIWVHDYQLMLLPALIRAAFPKISIGFFLHIPFPSYEIFRMLPWRKELLEGMLGADQIGFHTFGYMRHFLSSTYRIAGYEHSFGRLKVGTRMVNVDVFPMGIDYSKYAHSKINDQLESVRNIKAYAKKRKLIISIDRLDYTKGIPQRIRAFEQFLKQYPAFQRNVSLVLVVVPSRSNVDQYQELKESVDTLVGQINGRYGSFDWQPILYFYRPLNFDELSVLYQVADVAMITPLRDGMNLVAKEFVASKDKSKMGVLILSEMAGAADELNDAIIINPQDQNEMVASIGQALTMDPKEQAHRLEKMQKRLQSYTVANWADNFLNEQSKVMEEAKGKQANLMSAADHSKLIAAFQTSQKKLIILDYDGTLMNFHADPQAVEPDKALLEILEQLIESPGLQLIVNSGRDRATLEKWLGHLKIDLVAEHGVWLRQHEGWEQSPGLLKAWKTEIIPLFENLVDRTPGSFIEEKEFSLAWHYRKSDKDLGEKRVREFRDVLLYLTHNLGLQVLEGNKVIEVKNSGVNKGKALSPWLQAKEYDFILAIGDDHTDEDIFIALPERAHTIKVGGVDTAAKYQIEGVEKVRNLLNGLITQVLQEAEPELDQDWSNDS